MRRTFPEAAPVRRGGAASRTLRRRLSDVSPLSRAVCNIRDITGSEARGLAEAVIMNAPLLSLIHI